MKPRWFRDHVAYTMAKYGMSMCVLGMAEEFKGANIAFNALWPKTGMAIVLLEKNSSLTLNHCFSIQP
jgi:citronellol/citronellal dehydrogenase